MLQMRVWSMCIKTKTLAITECVSIESPSNWAIGLRERLCKESKKLLGLPRAKSLETSKNKSIATKMFPERQMAELSATLSREKWQKMNENLISVEALR